LCICVFVHVYVYLHVHIEAKVLQGLASLLCGFVFV